MKPEGRDAGMEGMMLQTCIVWSRLPRSPIIPLELGVRKPSALPRSRGGKWGRVVQHLAWLHHRGLWQPHALKSSSAFVF